MIFFNNKYYMNIYGFGDNDDVVFSIIKVCEEICLGFEEGRGW